MIKDLKEKSLKEIFEYGQVKEIPEDRYTNMSYPKLIKLMKFRVDRYTLTGFGHLMIMHTTTKMGMELLTMSFMPDYKNKLEAFRNRMINEGNPSSATLKLLLKEDGAKTFMEKIIMPI